MCCTVDLARLLLYSPANHGKVVLLPLNLIFKFMFGLRKIVLPTDLALLPPFAIINLVATGLMGYKAWYVMKPHVMFLLHLLDQDLLQRCSDFGYQTEPRSTHS